MKHTAMEKKVFRYVVVIVCSGTGIMSPTNRRVKAALYYHRNAFFVSVPFDT